MTAATQAQTPQTFPAGLTAAVLIERYAAAVAATRARVLAALARLFATHHRSPESFIHAAVTVLGAGQRVTAALTAAYLAQLHGTVTGGSHAPAGVPLDQVTDKALRGVPATEVYRRPLVTLWTELAHGKSPEDALGIAQRRLQTTAATDLQLAATHTARTVLGAQKNIVGYRRVLTGDHHCGLCILASTQRYHIKDLLPIHPNCQCVVAPIMGTSDPGRSVNSAVLTGGNPLGHTAHGVGIYDGDNTLDTGDLSASVHQAMKDRFGSSSASGSGRFDYRHIMVTREHGELGPVLTVADQHFLTQREIADRNLRRE